MARDRTFAQRPDRMMQQGLTLRLISTLKTVLATLAMAILDKEVSLLIQEIDTVPDQAHHPQDRPAMTTTVKLVPVLDTPEMHPQEQQAMTTTTISKLELDTPELVHQEQVLAAMAVMATSKPQDCQEGGRNPRPQEELAMLLKVGRRLVQQTLQTRRVMAKRRKGSCPRSWIKSIAQKPKPSPLPMHLVATDLTKWLSTWDVVSCSVLLTLFFVVNKITIFFVIERMLF
jgi:hypothetical protein